MFAITSSPSFIIFPLAPELCCKSIAISVTLEHHRMAALGIEDDAKSRQIRFHAPFWSFWASVCNDKDVKGWQLEGWGHSLLYHEHMRTRIGHRWPPKAMLYGEAAAAWDFECVDLAEPSTNQRRTLRAYMNVRQNMTKWCWEIPYLGFSAFLPARRWLRDTPSWKSTIGSLGY